MELSHNNGYLCIIFSDVPGCYTTTGGIKARKQTFRPNSGCHYQSCPIQVIGCSNRDFYFFPFGSLRFWENSKTESCWKRKSFECRNVLENFLSVVDPLFQNSKEICDRRNFKAIIYGLISTWSISDEPSSEGIIFPDHLMIDEFHLLLWQTGWAHLRACVFTWSNPISESVG